MLLLPKHLVDVYSIVCYNTKELHVYLAFGCMVIYYNLYLIICVEGETEI